MEDWKVTVDLGGRNVKHHFDSEQNAKNSFQRIEKNEEVHRKKNLYSYTQFRGPTVRCNILCERKKNQDKNWT